MDGETGSLAVPPDQLLTLAGRLDDAPGFDAPRERFRRFLTGQITSFPLVRTLIEEWQRATGEQHHRALQDALVLLGRFLGFETTFGTYQPTPGMPRNEGQWRSRHRLHVLLELRTHYSPSSGLDSLSRSLVAMPPMDADARRLGLCAVTPLYSGRAALEDALAADRANADLRVVSTNSLLTLAGMIDAGTLTGDDLVKLLVSSTDLDFIVELLGARAHRRASGEIEDADATHGSGPFWAAVIGDDGTVPASQIVQLLIARRHVLGVTDAPHVESPPRVDDWVCFLTPGPAVAGQAQVASIADDDAYLVRGPDRFNRVIRLKNVEIYDPPRRVAVEEERRLTGSIAAQQAEGPMLVPISRRQFAELTASREGTDATGGTTRSRGSVHPIGQRPTGAARRTADGGT